MDYKKETKKKRLLRLDFAWCAKLCSKGIFMHDFLCLSPIWIKSRKLGCLKPFGLLSYYQWFLPSVNANFHWQISKTWIVLFHGLNQLLFPQETCVICQIQFQPITSPRFQIRIDLSYPCMLDAFGSDNQTRLFISLDITCKISYYFNFAKNKPVKIELEEIEKL